MNNRLFSWNVLPLWVGFALILIPFFSIWRVGMLLFGSWFAVICIDFCVDECGDVLGQRVWVFRQPETKLSACQHLFYCAGDFLGDASTYHEVTIYRLE